MATVSHPGVFQHKTSNSLRYSIGGINDTAESKKVSLGNPDFLKLCLKDLRKNSSPLLEFCLIFSLKELRAFQCF